ncbi:CusA/CzcA family heavy metal efflux RND transporter [Sphingomonas rhizophila]|uniref:CusA/CzcA family heavy metal efflux RND transporter n=1 Tax=Sphingomonas rhizophila TaxID=2071607 RepID=A0A7G9SCN5_9SPHN|nr:CusA/CzcA family heavy metal efflux RND transporter [Sphingomonas rhizophila]QNN65610.1 CusA/CzcA family heavy metal efflux RND transporter [Sphingomonas rhizophila]
MIDRLLDASVRFRWAVLAITALVAIYGAFQLFRLPIDAVPDITNKQVQVNVAAPQFSPLDMERLVTFPVENSLAGIPGLNYTRSISRNGFAQVTAVFEEDVDLYFARQQVAERLAQAGESLPDGIQPQMGPVSTGLGEVLMWSVDYAPTATAKNPKIPGRPGFQPDGSYLTPEGERLTDDVSRLAYLRTVQDWIIRPQIRGVDGIAGVDSIGGYEKQFVVQPNPGQLAAYGVSFTELAEALEKANLSVGANFIQRGGEAFLVRADARIRHIDEIGRTVIANRNGVPVTVANVATVTLGGELRTGAASLDGKEVVIGTALMLAGENSRIVAQGVAERLDEVKKSLPPGVRMTTLYDRSALVDATISTVEKNLVEGALLVIVALFLLLGNIRAAIIAALVIPLSFLMMAIGMNRYGVSGNLMSLGALDFGLIVDGSIIIIENCLRRLAERQHHEGRLLNLSERLHEVFEASKEMVRPTIFGQAIIFLVFAPLLMFSGVEGKMFTPMAITVILALAGAFILSLTFVPAMVAVLIRGKVSEEDVRAIRWVKTRYEPLLAKVIAAPRKWVMAGVGAFVAAGLLFMTLGQEFIPQLDEGDLAMQAIRIPSTSLDQSLEMQKRVEAAISKLPEVSFIYSKTGTAEVATDPMPQNASDAFVILKPKDEWPSGVDSKEDIVERIEEKMEGLVGNGFEVSQPIEMRFNELIAGVRGDVAIKLFGDNMEQLETVASQVASAIGKVEGTADLRTEQTGGFPTLEVQFNRDAIARYGLSTEEVANTVAAGLGGREAGLVFEGDRRFDIVVRLDNVTRDNLDAIGALPVMLEASGSGPRASVPLRELANFQFTEGVNQVSRENGQRRVVVQANVRGRDLGSYVGAARSAVESQVKLPPGVFIQWGGQYENLQAASQRLTLVIPLVFALIFGILFVALRSVTSALAVYSAVPLGLAGGVFGLFLAGLPFSISAAVGFIVLSGVTVLNGLVVMTSIRQHIEQGAPIGGAIKAGMMERVRAVIITGVVPAIGFVPMAIATGRGAEVQKPLAIVVIAGLVVATLLTLFVLPAISQMLLHRGRQRHVEGEYGDEDAFGREPLPSK